MNDIWKSVRRTPYQSMGTFLILFFTLFLFLFFFVINPVFYGILGYVETRPQVIGYFKAETAEKDILAIKESLEESGKVISVNYVSQKEALTIYKDLNKDNPILLEMVPSNVLPASLEVNTLKPQYLEEVSNMLKAQRTIDEVHFEKLVVDRLSTLTNVLRQISMGIGIYLLITAVTVLFTTAAFKISVKKEEIQVLKLIGASNWYVRRPFVMEGVFFGVISGSLAYLTFFATLFAYRGTIDYFLSGIPKIGFFGLGGLGLYVYPASLEFMLLTFVIVLVVGSAIGIIGNMMATSKYIR